MQDNKKISYTTKDIYDYLSGKISPKDMYAMEKEALNNPLLSDAMEGYGMFPGSHYPYIQQNLDELRQAVSKRSITDKLPGFYWLKVAAAIVFITTITYATHLAIQYKGNAGALLAKNDPIKTNGELQKYPSATGIVSKNDSTFSPPQNPILEQLKNSRQSQYPLAVINNRNQSINLQEEKKSPGKNTSIVDTLLFPKDIPDIFSTGNTNPAIASFHREINENESQVFLGKIVDADNNGIPYAMLVINNNKQSKTDDKGNFSISEKGASIRLDVFAKNYLPATYHISESRFAEIILTPLKKNIRTNSIPEDFVKKYVKTEVLKKSGAMPKEGWTNYIDYLTEQVSRFEYENEKKIKGETIVTFEINKYNLPENYSFEKPINKDVQNAIEQVITNGPGWQKENDSILQPATIQIRIQF